MAGAQAIVIAAADVPVEGRAAVPVYVDDSLPEVGPVRNVVEVLSGPVTGGAPLAVRVVVALGGVGPALPVYVVSGNLATSAILAENGDFLTTESGLTLVQE